LAEGLKKELGLFGVFAVGAGAMISSGIFVLPGPAYAIAGAGVVVSYIMAALMIAPTMLSAAELATAMPRAGGDYFFITRSLGPTVGTVGGVGAWLSLILKSSFALVGAGAYAASLVDGLNPTSVIVVACIVFTVTNMFTAGRGHTAQIWMVVALLAIMVIYCVIGVPKVDVTRFSPLAEKGVGAIFAATGFVFISYGGLTKIASLSEEVKNPGRNLPLGMGLCLAVVALLYFFCVFVTVGVLERGRMCATETPLAEGAFAIMGNAGRILIDIAAILACLTTANAGIMAASRYPMAMARDGVFPRFLGRMSKGRGAPIFAVLLTGALVLSAGLLLDLAHLVEVASTILITVFVLVNLCVIVMRESKIQNYRPQFCCPVYPWLQILGMAAGIFLLIEMGYEPLLISAGFVVAALVWFFIYARKRVRQEFALIHLVERVTDRKLTTYTLEEELREIVRERDAVQEDRFDRLIRNCPVLDLEGPLSRDAFFEVVAAELAARLGLQVADLKKRLIEREEQSTTVLRPGLAVPHVVIEGEKRFEIAMARIRQGVVFSPEIPPVRIVFVLVGTPDERTFHLRALAAIAQVTQSTDFDQKWLAARSRQELRDIVILAERMRLPGEH